MASRYLPCLRPKSKIGPTRLPAIYEKGDLKKSASSLFSHPPCRLNVSFGNRSAYATPTPAIAALRLSSALRRSGRRSNNCDGSPRGRRSDGIISASMALRSMSSSGNSPIRRLMVFSVTFMRLSRLGISVAVEAYSTWVC